MTQTIAQYMSYLYNIGSWFTPVALLLRQIFFTLDSIIYTLIPVVYSFALELINIPLVANQNNVLKVVAKSIYSLLSVVMLFRLAFSLLTLMANPDKVEDKEVGAAKMFTNVIVCMILIMAIPAAFNAAMKIQDVLVGVKRDPATGVVTSMQAGVIDKIFLKGTDDQCIKQTNVFTGESQCIDLGSFISKSVFQIFFFPTQGALGEQVATQAYDAVFSGPSWAMIVLSPFINLPTLQGLTIPGLNVTIPIIPVFVFSYLFLVSTIVGGYLLWVFITLALDIAYRSVKLFALQLISPIAIVSYIDPHSQSKGIFKKWTDEVMKTYLSLFIRLATLAIVGLILMNIDWHPNPYSSVPPGADTGQALMVVFGQYNPFLKLFIFLGILTFLKTAPKMFEEIFGYKGKTKEEGFGASLLRGAFGGAASGAVGMISGGMSAKRNNLPFWSGAAIGGLEGIKGGASSAFGGKFGAFAKSIGGGSNAVGKFFGYKGGMEHLKEKMKYGAQTAAEQSIFNKYAKAYAADDAIAQTLVNDLKTQGIGRLNDTDVEMLRKTTAKYSGYKSILGDSKYAKALNNLDVMSTRERIYDRQVSILQAKVSSGNATATESSDLDVLLNYKGKVAKDKKEAEDTVKYYETHPDYQKEHQEYVQLTTSLNVPDNQATMSPKVKGKGTVTY